MVEQPSLPSQPAEHRPKRATTWWKVLIVGAVLYVAGIIVLIVTGNPNLFPTVVMVGSFLVPVVYVAFFYDHRHLSKVTLASAALSLVYGGILGVISASLLEQRLSMSQAGLAVFFEVGLIEELVKIVGVLIVAWRWQHRSEFDGLVLGAAAGMGFAAFESMGYAFSAFLASQGDLLATINVEFVRGILSPLGHGTWTAILAAVLFRESRNSRFFRVNWRVIVAYLVVVVLHTIWDLVGDALGIQSLPGIILFLGQAVVGLPGLALLGLRWREAIRQQRSEEATTLAADQPAQPSIEVPPAPES